MADGISMLVRKASTTNAADADKNQYQCLKRGYVVDIKDYAWKWTSGDLEKHVVIKCNDASLDWKEQEDYKRPWSRYAEFDEKSHDVETDTYELDVYCDNDNSSKEGKLSLTDADTAIKELNGTGSIAVGDNTNFSVKMYDVITAKEFFGRTDIVFREISYDKATGVHRVEADYSYYSTEEFSWQAVEKVLLDRGATIVPDSHDKGLGIVVFDINRTSLLDFLKFTIKDLLYKTIYTRRFYFADADVDAAEAADNVLDITKTELLAKIQDKVKE